MSLRLRGEGARPKRRKARIFLRNAWFIAATRIIEFARHSRHDYGFQSAVLQKSILGAYACVRIEGKRQPRGYTS
jgi:hypothetical protein